MNACKECGKPCLPRESGLCSYCDAFQNVRIKCPKCQKSRWVKKSHAKANKGKVLCAKCAQTKKAVEAICVNPECREPFWTTTAVLSQPQFSGLCPGCRKNTRLERNREAKERFKRKKGKRETLLMHGCTLFPRETVILKSGDILGRCRYYDRCRYGQLAPLLRINPKDECVNVVADKGWDGWGVSGRTETHLVPDAIVHAIHISTMPEIGFLDPRYTE